MNLLRSLRHSQRFASAIVLVLAVLGVLTGVSLSRVAALDAQFERLEQVALPTTRMVHDLALLADEARGLEALLLLLDDDRERRDVETRLMQQRGRIAERLASQVARLHDDSDRRLLADVNTALGAWWTVQDQVLGAARAAPGNPVQAQRARQLLAGESQAAYRQLIDTLERWWRHHDDLAQWSVKKARLEIAQRLQPMLGGLLFLSLAMLGLVLAQRALFAGASLGPAARPVATVRDDDAGLSAATHAWARPSRHARRGAPGPAEAAQALLDDIARQAVPGAQPATTQPGAADAPDRAAPVDTLPRPADSPRD